MIYKTIDEWIEHNPNHIGALPIEVCHQIWGTKGKGTIMTKDEALKLALEGLQCANSPNGDYEDVITAIKEALAQEQEQHQDWCASLTQMLMSMPPKPAPCNCKPQIAINPEIVGYVAPQRTWVGLTYEEETELIRLAHNHAGIRFYIQSAEAKLKEKNNV